jgi:hypothetical protein
MGQDSLSLDSTSEEREDRKREDVDIRCRKELILKETVCCCLILL